MTNPEFEYVLEFMATTVERSLIARLQDDPNDDAVRGALGDYLEENGRPKAAVGVRNGWTPGGMPKNLSSYPSSGSSDGGRAWWQSGASVVYRTPPPGNVSSGMYVAPLSGYAGLNIHLWGRE